MLVKIVIRMVIVKTQYTILVLSALLLASAHGTVQAQFAAKPTASAYIEIPRSTLDAIERRLMTERRPAFRVELLLRWVKSKEEYETFSLSKKHVLPEDGEYRERPGIKPSERMEVYRGFKLEIIKRLQREVESLETVPRLKLDSLYREVAFRHLELQEFQESLVSFLKLNPILGGDWMGIGDAYFANNEILKALDAYEKGSADPKFRVVAAYKRAWCFLSLSQFNRSLSEFDLSLSLDPEAPLRLKEEAFRDRLRPYVEVFSKPSFEDSDANALKMLASTLFPKEPGVANKLYLEALNLLIDYFNSKAKIVVAQSVFEFVKRDSPDARKVLLQAAPQWIKVYRGALDHDAVERVLKALPETALVEQAPALQGEIYNTIVYYDTLVKDELKDLEDNATAVSQKYLLLANKKYFALFPNDKNSDPLRVGYAKILLDSGESETCLFILAGRGGQEKEVEDLALSFEAKCNLKLLDQLYKEGITPRFKEKLRMNILEKKTYLRSDLGLSSTEAFESMARMLIGALKVMPQDSELRSILAAIVKEEVLPKSEALMLDLKLLQSELDFVDVANSHLDDEKKASAFFVIYSAAPKGLEIRKKALTLSVQLTSEEEGLTRCNEFKNEFPQIFRAGQDIFERCVLLADRYYDLEREAFYLASSSAPLDEKMTIKLALLEMAQNKDSGRKRLLALKTDTAKKALAIWSSSDAEVTGAQKQHVDQEQKLIEDFQRQVTSFEKLLKPISFQQIGRFVPARVKTFADLDAHLVRVLKQKRSSLISAHALEARARLAASMAQWMKALPLPPKLDEAQKADYLAKTAEVVNPWLQGAEARQKECSELAHTLTYEFRLKDSTTCPYIENKAQERLLMEAWEATRQVIPSIAPWKESKDKVQTARRLLERANEEKDVLRAKYHYMRVFDFAENDYERARAFLGLAQLSGRQSFWESALSLDGNCIEALEWKRKLVTGNPFFEALLDTQISKVR